MVTDELQVAVLPGEGGDIGCLTLNRPSALNALTFDMCAQVLAALQRWDRDPLIKGVFIQGAGDRAFCAGGDVRSIYAMRQQQERAVTFFQQEYAMNQALFHFSKPYIAWLDGITMGGGVGVSIYGSHRLATEHFKFAMPETLIGFFPDIGAGYFLNRCPHYLGYYLGLVGATIHAADAQALGLVTHTLSRTDKQRVLSALCSTPFGKDARGAVSDVLDTLSGPRAAPLLTPHYAEIEHCFAQPTVAEIFLALEGLDNPWAQQTLNSLQQRSPTSLMVTLEYLQRCRTLSFDEVMQLNLTLAKAFLHHHDFFEGVRAVLIDKDQQPQWQPDSVSDIKSVAEYFTA